MSQHVQRLFAYCSYLWPNFIDAELLDELFPNENKLQDHLDYCERRGLIELDERDKTVGYAITHRCLQKEMQEFYHDQGRESCEVILKRIAEFMAMRVKEPCDRDVQKKESIDLDFKQVKYLISQLETNTNLRDFFTELNDKLGYFYLFYEENYKKELNCFKQVRIVYENKNQEDIATSLYNIGLAYYRLGNLDNGFNYATKAYELRKTIYENKPHEKLAHSLSNLEFYRECHEMRKSLYGEKTNHPEIARVSNYIGACYACIALNQMFSSLNIEL